MELLEQLRIRFTGKESEGYKAYNLIEIRIKDHSANYRNNQGRVLSFVTEEKDPTANKFVSDNINISGKSFEEASTIIIKNIFEAAIEEINESDNDYDKSETILDLYNSSIVDEIQAKKLFEIAKIEDDEEIAKIEDTFFGLW